MCVLPQLIETQVRFQIQSLAAVAFARPLGIEFNITELARARGVCRSTMYRQAQQLHEDLQSLPLLRSELQQLRSQNQLLHAQVQELQTRLPSAESATPCEVTPEKVALTALELFARGLGLEGIRAALSIAFAPLKPPSLGTLAAIIKQGAILARRLGEDASNIYPLDTVEFDELYHAGDPILVMLEPYSMAVVFLEALGDAKSSSWSFAMEYHGVKPPPILGHDCSGQGRVLVEHLHYNDRKCLSQLCWWHRLREVRRELEPQLTRIYKKALLRLDESMWDKAYELECSIGELFVLSDPIDRDKRRVRREEAAYYQLLAKLDLIQTQIVQLAECSGQKLQCKALLNMVPKAQEFVNHLTRWDWIADGIQMEPILESFETPWTLLDAMAAAFCTQRAMEEAYQNQDENLYWQEQERFLVDCANLRRIQAECRNSGFALREFWRMIRYKTRTSSRTEALNRRLRGFTQAKRQINDNLLALMQLHHNTTPFSKDSKRAGKSPWQRLGLQVPGLEDGFVGVLKAANQGNPWPSTWELKR